MKTLSIILLLLGTATVSAKSLEITVPNVRNDKGAILVMAKSGSDAHPVYGRADAKTGAVIVRLDSLQTDAVEISLFHDEDGDYQMKMGDRGPVEGYATKKCKLADEQNALKINLFYPTVNQ